MISGCKEERGERGESVVILRQLITGNSKNVLSVASIKKAAKELSIKNPLNRAALLNIITEWSGELRIFLN